MFHLWSLLWLPCVVALNGTWKQVLTNYYVQTTTEIDWTCTRVLFYTVNETLMMSKHAYIHDPLLNNTVTLPGVPVTLNDTSALINNVTYDVRVANEDMLFVTGRDEPSLFVWTLDISKFYSDDLGNVLNDLIIYNYTSTDKQPLTSYDVRCEFYQLPDIDIFQQGGLRLDDKEWHHLRSKGSRVPRSRV